MDMKIMEVSLSGTDAQHAESDFIAAKKFFRSLPFISTSLFRRFLHGDPKFIFETVLHEGKIHFLLGTQRIYFPYLEKQFLAQYPEARIRNVHTRFSFYRGVRHTGFLHPKRSDGSSDLAIDVPGAFIRICSRAHKSSSISLKYTMQYRDGGDFFIISQLSVSAPRKEESERLIQTIAASLHSDRVRYDAHARHGFIVQADHLAMLFRIFRMHPARVVPPTFAGMPGSGTLLGHAVRAGISIPLHLSDSDRKRHVYCVGSLGTGRHVFLFNMIMQDIRAGKQVALIDVEGELVDEARHAIAQYDAADHVKVYTSRDEAARVLSQMDVDTGSCLYVDEFQELLSDNAMQFLERANASGVSLVLSHHSVAGMAEEARVGLMEAVGTTISFADFPKFTADVRLFAGGSLRDTCTMETHKTAV